MNVNLSCVIVLALAASVIQGSTQSPTIVELLEKYDRGEHDEAMRGALDLLPASDAHLTSLVAHSPFDRAFKNLQTFAPGWIAAKGEGEAIRRGAVVAAFTLELIRLRPDPYGLRGYPLVVWSCELLRSAPTRHPAARWWYLASIGLMEDAGDWRHILGAASMKPLGDSRVVIMRRGLDNSLSPADRDEAARGHAAHAREAFPDEPRFLLTQVHYEESETFASTFNGPRGINGQEVPAEVVALLQKAADGKRVEMYKAAIERESAKVMVNRLNKLPAVADAYAKLAAQHPTLRGDSELHIGFIDLRVGRREEALERFRKVPLLTNEPFLVGLSHHFSGWILERTGRPDEAIAEYRRALELAPRARSVSILLAAQLALAGRQAEAYEVLTPALQARPAPVDPVMVPARHDDPVDPWPLYSKGDAVLVPMFISRMREALK